MAVTRSIRTFRVYFDDNEDVLRVICSFDVKPPADADNPDIVFTGTNHELSVEAADLSAGNKTSLGNLVAAFTTMIDLDKPINQG